ncbi:uncharacterized protein LY79DRAFT_584988 [Colletotrichum navitas]|uniref:Uncharacterized protein n=1 Tax=Colletotrichum navitas TaxID=681940 RepID=A0AAD8PKF3_9PEZI|nr:uncharacterized protein LY79DRAFT_584988 [Colletotrichum navitas]KAK1566139.1 hypothetical protein LY79DRAFT_584988 [Colletotrichum navitas]
MFPGGRGTRVRQAPRAALGVAGFGHDCPGQSDPMPKTRRIYALSRHDLDGRFDTMAVDPHCYSCHVCFSGFIEKKPVIDISGINRSIGAFLVCCGWVDNNDDDAATHGPIARGIRRSVAVNLVNDVVTAALKAAKKLLSPPPCAPTNAPLTPPPQLQEQ